MTPNVGDACYVGAKTARVYFRIDEIKDGVAYVTCQNLGRGRVYVEDIAGAAPAEIAEEAKNWEAVV